VIRIAAAGDIHASTATRARLAAAFADVVPHCDAILLAGDLTTTGEPEQAAVLADACRDLGVPVFAVLGNHDHHAARPEEVCAVLQDAGIRTLARGWASCEVNGMQLGIVGTKGFIGGFPGSSLPDFGEPLLRQAYGATSEEAAAIAAGLQEVVHCDIRVVLLHYAPIVDTLEGEPEGIHTYLGCDRLAIPIAEYRPDLVVHGHSHAGSFEGRIGDVPVYNVSVHVTGRDFWIFNLEGSSGHTRIGLEEQAG
jgi:Icc-related predicted phosphoesterase